MPDKMCIGLLPDKGHYFLGIISINIYMVINLSPLNGKKLVDHYTLYVSIVLSCLGRSFLIRNDYYYRNIIAA